MTSTSSFVASMDKVPLFPEAAIVQLQPKHLVGLSVRTSMQAAAVDCAALWQRFIPWVWRVHGLAGSGYACPSFGLALDTDMQSGHFTYWASIEVQSSFADPAQWPSGFAGIELAGGPYVGAAVPSLATLSDAYTYFYGPWANAQHEYALDFGGICFEYYDQNYLENGSLKVFAPLRAQV